jgi:uncharacterized membrane protein
MRDHQTRWSDERVDNIMGNLLRAGVVMAATVVLAGAIVYLMRSSAAPVAYSRFQGQPASLRTVGGIVAGVLSLDSRSIIQLGLVLLIATPIARVLFALIAFTLQGDRKYMLISGIVLAVLIASLASGVATL